MAELKELPREMHTKDKIDMESQGMTSIASSSTSNTSRSFAIDRSCAYQLMADHIFKLATNNSWFSNQLNIANGVGIRVSRGQYVISPKDDPRLDAFKASLLQLNQEIAMTFSAPVVQAITHLLTDSTPTLALSTGENVQVLDKMEDLGGARDAQGACFIRLEGKLVIWCSEVSAMVNLAQSFEQLLINYVWRCASFDDSKSSSTTLVSSSSSSSSSSSKSITSGSKSLSTRVRSFWSKERPQSSTTLGSITEIEKEEEKYQEEAGISAPRYPCHLKDLYTGLAITLNIVIYSLSMKTYFRQCLLDGEWSRMAVAVTIPFGFAVAFFFCENVISVIMQFFAPISQMSKNSVYYSAIAPVRLTGSFPHLTIMIPVYKESLKDVLAPTIESVQVAIRTYELQGGTANLLICEDGLQVVDEDESSRRIDYYERHSCAYVARHPSNRAGRFKKSSNMNTALELSLRIEELLLEQRPMDVTYSQIEEESLYNRCMTEALDELEGRVLAQGDIRIGDYILLLDSDTRIPADSFLDSISEMEECPDVAILQHCSGTFLAGAGYFENFIAFFTKMVNYGISWVVSNGMSAPFMGHNAFLRWSALQEQAIKFGGEDKKVWSEAHVSEDFVMSLNLASAGYLIRWATYSKSEFLEGVSLSCDDEVNRWQKYAFGCSEIMFNPVRHWFTKGPFASLYMKFLLSPGSTLAYKFSSTSYVLSYWAIACAVPTNICLYWAVVYFRDELDGSYIPPFELFMSIIVVYLLGSSIGFAVSRYRSKDCDFTTALWQQLKSIPFTVIFFAGVSYHVFIALVAHLCSYNMTWSATQKDLTDTTFFEELPRVLRKYWHAYLVMISTLIAVLLFSTQTIGLHWQQNSFNYIFPLIWLCAAHILYPLVLNPTLMLFRF